MAKEKYRRIVCERAVYNRGLTMVEASRLCDKRARQMGKEKVTFCDASVGQFINCACNYSRDKLYILADVLGAKDTKEIDEKFKEPKTLFVGLDWEGEFGSRYQDIKER